MAAKTMKDYLSADTADYTGDTLTLQPQEVIEEEGYKNIITHEYDDGSESSIALSNASIFFATLRWDHMSAADAGTIMEFYHNSSKANGTARSIQWTHYDGNTYVVKFVGRLPRSFGRYAHSVSIKFKVLGYVS